MSFREKYGCVLDVCMDEFGAQCEEPVIYRPIKGGGEFKIRAIYDRDAITVDPDTEQVISTSEPMIGVKLADLLFSPSVGDQVTVLGEQFKVVDTEDDAHGGMTMKLHKTKKREKDC